MTVNQDWAPIRQLSRNEHVDVPDFIQQTAQRGNLRGRMSAPIFSVWQQVLGANPTQLPDTVADMDAADFRNAARSFTTIVINSRR